MTPAHLKALIEEQLADIRDERVTAGIRQYLIEPVEVMRVDEEDRAWPCWTVFRHVSSNTGIGYCEHAFGPVMPWGIVNLEGDIAELSLGLDFKWSFTLAEAWFNAEASADAPIWRVFAGSGMESDAYAPVTQAGSWREAQAWLAALQRDNPGAAYEVDADEFVRFRRLP